MTTTMTNKAMTTTTTMITMRQQSFVAEGRKDRFARHFPMNEIIVVVFSRDELTISRYVCRSVARSSSVMYNVPGSMIDIPK